MGGFLTLVVVLVVLAILLVTLSDFKPPARQVLKPVGNIKNDRIENNQISLLTWNIGYAGLGSEMDFFYDGGKKVRPQQEYYNQCFDGIKNFIRQNDSVDFIFLQEVDEKAKRSFRDNQVVKLQGLLPAFESVFAVNYDVIFVPVPVNNPMGKVVSGMLSFSKFNAVSSERVSFEGNFAWPKNLFMLDRCFIIQRFLLNSGKVLVLINTHNSAFDDGTLRKAELKVLRETALAEFQKGNYVIVGGDWNISPPDFESSTITSGDVALVTDLSNAEKPVNSQVWHRAFDNSTPTNRFVDESYQKGHTKTTIIDYFMLSPNVRLINVETFNLGFQFSDHNPVKMNIQLF